MFRGPFVCCLFSFHSSFLCPRSSHFCRALVMNIENGVTRLKFRRVTQVTYFRP